MTAGAAVVVRLSAGVVHVLQLGGEPDALCVLLAEARTLGETLRVLNVPADDPARLALEALGGRQHEMVLRL